MALNGPSDVTLTPGESASVAIDYSVTTERYSTSLYASVVDENGIAAEGWSVFAGGTDTASWTDTSAAVRGASFSATFVVTSPGFVQTPHVVRLVLWSEVTTDSGVERVAENQVMARFSVNATPAEPSISCEEGAGRFCLHA